MKRQPLALLVCAAFLLPVVALAQFTNIRVSNPASTDPEEVTIAINPTNPLNLAAGANITYYYYSFDGGLTWSEGTLSSSFGVWGDPCVGFDADGDLYYAHLSNPPAGSWLDRIVVQRSTDGGVHWNDGAGVGLNPPRYQDKEWLAVDLTESPWHNSLYLCWTEFDDIFSPDPADSSRILFARSVDGGFTWSTPVRVSERQGGCLDGDDTVEGAVPAVGPGGEIYTAWAGHELIYFDRSLDGGTSWGQDRIIATQPGGWNFTVPGIYRCNGFPITACDVSASPFRGNVYVCWSDQRNGTGDTDVFFMTSSDGGDTWGDIVRVNDDPGAAHQFFCWMTVDPVTGIIYVVFYDRRATTGNATEVWMARSVDGGQSFSNFRISETPFTPTSGIFFGDYINIAARAGKVYPIWMRMDAGALSVWTAPYTDPIIGVEPAATMPGADLLAGVPNPLRPGQSISFELPVPGVVELAVYDTRGRRLETLASGYRGAGPQTVAWRQGEPGPGVYFLDLRAGRYSSVRKLVVLE